MNFFKRALIQVRANSGKSILIFIIFLVTMGAVATGFMTSRMYNKTLKETFKDGTVPVSIRNEYPDTVLSSLTYDWNDEQFITGQQYFDIAEFEQVASSEINLSSMISGSQLELPNQLRDYDIDISYLDNPEQSTAIGNFEAYQFDYDQDAFKSNPNAVIINDQILELNEISVGDTITLDLNAPYADNRIIPELEEQEFTVVGSYTITPTQEMIDYQNEMAEKYDEEPDLTFSYLYSNIFMPFAKGQEVMQITEQNGANPQYGEGVYTSAIYSLKSLDQLKSFETDVEAFVGMPIEINFQLNDESDNEMANALSTIEQIKDMLNYFLMFGIMVVIVLLTILITLFIRGRKKEIGIMAALGATKRDIYFQLVTEQVIIMTIATLVGYPICLMILSVLSAKFGFLGLGFTIVPLIESLVVGAIIIGLITIIPAVYTLRVNPKKILL